MPLAFSVEMTTDLVSPRALRQILNRINRDTGKRFIRGPLMARFDHRLYKELGSFAHKRNPKYTERKLKRRGHDFPNVYSGTMKQRMPSTAVVTATASGGKVLLRAPWAGKAKAKKGGKFAKQGMPEWQRQELTTLSERESKTLVNRQREQFQDLSTDPRYARKRAVR